MWLVFLFVHMTNEVNFTYKMGHKPADRCFCTDTVPPLPSGSCGDPHRAPGTWAWWARGSSAMFDAFCSWWHRRAHLKLAAFYQLRETLRKRNKMTVTTWENLVIFDMNTENVSNGLLPWLLVKNIIFHLIIVLFK